MQRWQRSVRELARTVLVLAAGPAACQADPLQLEGRACDARGQCLAGWVCDMQRNLCVRPAELEPRGGSAAAGASGQSASSSAGISQAEAGAASVGGAIPGGAAGLLIAGAGGAAALAGASGAAAALAGASGAAGHHAGAAGGGTAGASGTSAAAGAAGHHAGAAGGPATECPAPLGDCDGDPGNGCETDLRTAVEHCGGCHRACADAGVTSRVCSQGRCTSTCVMGWANCSKPTAPDADDGCETPANQDESCGGCDNDCTAQSTVVGLSCSARAPYVCGCEASNRCRYQGTCDQATGLCNCGGTECRPGEICGEPSVATVVCSCNLGPGCGPDEVCCQSPSGCRNLQSDRDNCGACGRACPPGFSCTDGGCVCTAAAQCNAGSPGSCNAAGRCSCASASCDEGGRCTADGGCG